MKPESKTIKWEKFDQPIRVKIKTWDQMASEGKIDDNGDILLPSETYFVTPMEERMPTNRIIDLTDMEWEDSKNIHWDISDDMIEEVFEKTVEYKTHIHPWDIKYIPRTKKLIIGCKKYPLNTWKNWTPKDVRYMSHNAEKWWRKNKEDLLNSIEQLEPKPDKLED